MEVSFKSAGRLLRGEMMLPKSKERPFVILLHGLNASRMIPLIKAAEEALSKQGIGTLSFDFAGEGASSGNYKDITIPNQVNDVFAALSFVRAQGIENTITLLGHSQGSAVAILAAAREASMFSSLVLFAPAGAIADQFNAGHIAGVYFDPIDIPEQVDVYGYTLGREYFRSGQKIKLYDAAAMYPGAVLIVNGDSDDLVPLSYAKRFARTFPCAKLEVIHGADHNFTVGSAEAVTRALVFLK